MVQRLNVELMVVLIFLRCFTILDANTIRCLEPDMWTAEWCWEKLNPLVPFDQLPLPLMGSREAHWDAKNYPDLVQN